MLLLHHLFQKGPSCWGAPLPESSCQSGDWKQCCHYTSSTQNIEGLCVISLWMVCLSPGSWGRPDPCAPYKSWLLLLLSSAAGTADIWLLGLLAWRFPRDRCPQSNPVLPGWSHRGSSQGRTAPGHTWGCPMGLEDTTNTGQMCLCPRHRGCSAEYDTTMLWGVQLSCFCSHCTPFFSFPHLS